MTDITITAIESVSQATTYERIQAGEAVSLGDVLYKLTTSSTYFTADCTTSATTAAALGIVETAVSLDAYGIILKSGPVLVTLSAGTLTQGEAYYLSENGLLMPHGDLATNDYITYIGQAKSTTILDLDIKAYGWVKT